MLLLYCMPKKSYMRVLVLVICALLIMTTDINKIIFLIAGLFSEQYLSYATHSYYGGRVEYGTGLSFVFAAILPLCVLYNSRKMKRQNGGDFILSMNVLYLLTIPLELSAYIFYRIREMLTFVPFISIGYFLECNKKYRNIYYLFFLIMYLVYFFHNIRISEHGSGFFPYRSIFTK
jgi:hypothetical protein